MTPAMKCGSTAILPNSPVQLDRVSVMTPIVLVPALSSSWAMALSSTPVSRKENPDRFIAGGYDVFASGCSLLSIACRPSAAADDHTARIPSQFPHRHAVARQGFVGFDLHDRIGLVRRVPALLPFGQRRDRLVGLAPEAHRQLVSVCNRRHRAPQVP